MPRLLMLTVLSGASFLAAAAGAANDAAPTPAADSVNECASVTASARMQALGYAHVLTLVNHCQRPVSCEVWTNVDPTPHLTLSANPGESAEVIARVGSPSRDVHAGKQCHFSG